MLTWTARIAGVVLLSAVAPSMAAQEIGSSPAEPPVSIAEGQFGTAANQSIIPIQRLVGIDTNQVFVGAATGYYSATSGSDAQLWAPLEMPPGTLVQSICVEAFDIDAAEGLTVLLVGGETGSSGNLTPFSGALAGATTGVGPVPGFVSLCLAPLGVFSFPLLVRNAGNLDGVGTDTIVQYYLFVGLPATAVAAAVRVGPAVVTWTRFIAPPPAEATFLDVEPGDDYYRVIEAAAAAGIMTACDGGPNFCPQAPVTRQQLAMFLARALGLHWAN
jgi:S-layer family protein